MGGGIAGAFACRRPALATLHVALQHANERTERLTVGDWYRQGDVGRAEGGGKENAAAQVDRLRHHKRGGGEVLQQSIQKRKACRAVRSSGAVGAAVRRGTRRAVCGVRCAACSACSSAPTSPAGRRARRCHCTRPLGDERVGGSPQESNANREQAHATSAGAATGVARGVARVGGSGGERAVVAAAASTSGRSGTSTGILCRVCESVLRPSRHKQHTQTHCSAPYRP